jgi:hypothetical protein
MNHQNQLEQMANGAMFAKIATISDMLQEQCNAMDQTSW